jgi:predicted esterase
MCVALCATLATVFHAANLNAQGAPPSGVIVERVACPSDRSQTYTLYLPSAYNAAKKWPLLFVLDPRGRGTVAAEVFREAAERYGWIIVSSNNTTSDGEWEPNRRALSAMWPDVRRAYAVDDRRIYVTGFSGTATVASIVAETSKEVAGIIAVGAPERTDPKLPPKNVAWFGTSGRLDFNYTDTKRTGDRMARAGIVNRIEFFDGGHQWMPPNVAARALGWLELRAMKDGLRPKDTDLARRVIGEDLTYAKQLETAGQITEALSLYKSIASHYEGLGDGSSATARSTELEKDERVKSAIRDEQRIDSRERVTIAEIMKTLRALQEPEVPLAPHIITALKVPALRRTADGTGPEADSAKRLLEVLTVQTSFYIPREFERLKQFDRAALALEIATSAHPDRPYLWVELAAHRARMNQKSKALTALQRAVDAGYRDAAALESDPRFAQVRATPEFTELLRKIPSK